MVEGIAGCGPWEPKLKRGKRRYVSCWRIDSTGLDLARLATEMRVRARDRSEGHITGLVQNGAYKRVSGVLVGEGTYPNGLIRLLLIPHIKPISDLACRRLS